MIHPLRVVALMRGSVQIMISHGKTERGRYCTSLRILESHDRSQWNLNGIWYFGTDEITPYNNL